MKFRKKPIVLEADQFIEENHTPDGVNYGYPTKPGESHWLANKYWISTLEGPLTVSNLDWVVTGIKGEKYPVKPDIFEDLYEKVDE